LPPKWPPPEDLTFMVMGSPSMTRIFAFELLYEDEAINDEEILTSICLKI